MGKVQKTAPPQKYGTASASGSLLYLLETPAVGIQIIHYKQSRPVFNPDRLNWSPSVRLVPDTCRANMSSITDIRFVAPKKM